MKYALFLGNAGHDSGGPEIYETELTRALAGINCEDEFHVMCLFPRAQQIVGVDQHNFNFHLLQPGIRVFNMTLGLPYRLRRLAPDAVHSTFMPCLFPLRAHVVTLVCFSMFERPEFYPPAVGLRLRVLTSMGVRSASLLLCISEMVRDRFVERFKVSPDRMAVVPLGASLRFRPHSPEEIESYLGAQKLRDPYFLFCGRWEQRKNLLGIIEAFASFKRQSKLPHKLVLTGKRTWIEKQAEALIDRLDLRKEVIDHGKTAAEELPLLYAGATALVYASFYESFGMPIIEAMACGTPVITSNTTAMPETAGGAALLVDPHGPETIAAAMYQVAADAALAESLRRRGLQRAKAFTWEATALATLNAYRRVAAVN